MGCCFFYMTMQEKQSAVKDVAREKDLRALYTKGNGEVTEEFLRYVTPFMLWLQRRYTHQEDEDVLQDQYVRILKAMTYWNPEKSLLTFLYTVGRNACSRQNEKTKKERLFVSLDLVLAHQTSSYHLPDTSYLQIHDTLIHATPEISDLDLIIQRWDLWRSSVRKSAS